MLIELDKQIMILLNRSISNSVFDSLMPLITNNKFLGFIGILLIAHLLINCGKIGKISILILIIAVGLTDMISAQLIKPFIGRLRPSYEFIDSINLLVKKGGKWSFPSNHAANSFAFATVLSYFFSKYKLHLFLLASVIAFSRVYVGVHYPFDILFGAIFGYTISWIALSIWARIKLFGLKYNKDWVLNLD